MEFGNSMDTICGHGLLQIEYMRQHLIAGLGIPRVDTSCCVNRVIVNLGQPPFAFPYCVPQQTITVDAVEARLRAVSGANVHQPARQAPSSPSVEARLRAMSGPSSSLPVSQDPSGQSAEARLPPVSEPSNNQPAPQPPTWQEAQAEIYLREERAFALLDDEYGRIMADLCLREEQERRIQEAEEASKRLKSEAPSQPNQPGGFSLNARTAERGSSVHSAGRWITSRRSRSQRYRDEIRARRNRPSGLSQVIMAEKENEVMSGRNEDNG